MNSITKCLKENEAMSTESVVNKVIAIQQYDTHNKGTDWDASKLSLKNWQPNYTIMAEPSPDLKKKKKNSLNSVKESSNVFK